MFDVPTEKIWVLDELCSGMIYSAVAVSLLLTSQRYILNKVPLNRNTFKTRFHQLVKMLQPETHRNLPLYFLMSSASVFTNAVFSTTLWNITIANHKNRLNFLA